MRWSEDELTRYLQRDPRGRIISEKAFQAAVQRLLRLYGYHFLYHTFDSRRSPSGFVDLLCAHEQPGHPLLALELKTDTGQVTAAQSAWLAALSQCTMIHTAVLRPSTLEAFVAQLKEL